MIRPSLKKAIERALDSHVYLGRSDFLLHEYQNKDDEGCLAVAYRSNRKFCFVVTVMNRGSVFQEPAFSVTMNPGREAFHETLALQGRPNLLEQLKAWQQRLHEDIGVFPVSRQFEAQIRRISRMEAKLGLTSKDTSKEADANFLEELAQWEIMLQEFISASQAMHQTVSMSYLKVRMNEIRKLQKCLQAGAAEALPTAEASALRGEVDRMSSSVAENMQTAGMLLEKLEAAELCLVESEVFAQMSELFEADSKKLDEIREQMAPMIDVGSEELKALRDRSAEAPKSLMSYSDDKRVKTLKEHLVAVVKMGEWYDGTRSGDTTEIQQTLQRMRKDMSLLSARDVLERSEFEKVFRNAFQRLPRRDNAAALAELEESVRTIDKTARTLVDDLINPLYLGDIERAGRERTVLYLIRKKQIVSAAIRLLEQERESNERFAKMFSQGNPTDSEE